MCIANTPSVTIATTPERKVNRHTAHFHRRAVLQRVGADGAWYELDNTKSLYAATMDKWRRTQYLELAERVS